MSESGLQRKCLEWLRVNHPRDICAANIHGGGWSAKGFPDLILCIDGRFCAFELKVGENGMQSDQRVWKKRIERAGGLHFTPYTLEEFINDVEDVLHDQGRKHSGLRV